MPSSYAVLTLTDLANIKITAEELTFLRTKCNFLSKEHLDYLETFRFTPASQVDFQFVPDQENGDENTTGNIVLHVQGLWLETILYEIPLLALVSEGYFKFIDKAWTYESQCENAKAKGLKLLEGGCVFSEFGTRRRRDYHTQDLVMQGLMEAQKEFEAGGKEGGKFTGSSNVHFSMKYGVLPVGTVAHEWFMGVAAITGDYKHANELALKYWVGTFGAGVSIRPFSLNCTDTDKQVLGIALTDTFGTRAFLQAFKHPLENDPEGRTYAEVFAGVRQDSGDPIDFIKLCQSFYDSLTDHKPKHTPTMVFSDSLNVEKCIHYRTESLKCGFSPTFGVGTFLTNDFKNTKTGEKSVPLNIVIKLSTAGGNFAVKISDNAGKNTGDQKTVDDVKRRLGYQEKEWGAGDEGHRWD
jgi:nicotinate phosphoribosyltransferase